MIGLGISVCSEWRLELTTVFIHILPPAFRNMMQILFLLLRSLPKLLIGYHRIANLLPSPYRKQIIARPLLREPLKPFIPPPKKLLLLLIGKHTQHRMILLHGLFNRVVEDCDSWHFGHLPFMSFSCDFMNP